MGGVQGRARGDSASVDPSGPLLPALGGRSVPNPPEGLVLLRAWAEHGPGQVEGPTSTTSDWQLSERLPLLGPPGGSQGARDHAFLGSKDRCSGIHATLVLERGGDGRRVVAPESGQWINRERGVLLIVHLARRRPCYGGGFSFGLPKAHRAQRLPRVRPGPLTNLILEGRRNGLGPWPRER